MPDLTPQQRTRLIAASAALVGLIGVSAIAFRSDDHAGRVEALLGDAGLSSISGRERTTDLSTAVVEPGATIKTGVNLPAGARASDVIGPGTFEIGLPVHVDRPDATWLEVTATNRTGAPMRFIGFVTYTMPADAGP